MIYNLRGQIYHISETETFSKKGDKKRTVTVSIGDAEQTNRIEHIPIDFLNDNLDITDKLEVGGVVEIQFKLTGRIFKPENNPNKLINYPNFIMINVRKEGRDWML